MLDWSAPPVDRTARCIRNSVYHLLCELTWVFMPSTFWTCCATIPWQVGGFILASNLLCWAVSHRGGIKQVPSYHVGLFSSDCDNHSALIRMQSGRNPNTAVNLGGLGQGQVQEECPHAIHGYLQENYGGAGENMAGWHWVWEWWPVIHGIVPLSSHTESPSQYGSNSHLQSQHPPIVILQTGIFTVTTSSTSDSTPLSISPPPHNTQHILPSRPKQSL